MSVGWVARWPATPLSFAAMRATLGEVLTADAFEHMINLADRYTADVQAILDANDLPWSITQLGARAEYRFARPAPRTGGESAAAADDQLDEFMHLFMINRGILMTPFHNMALMCPASTDRGRVHAHRSVPRRRRRTHRELIRPFGPLCAQTARFSAESAAFWSVVRANGRASVTCPELVEGPFGQTIIWRAVGGIGRGSLVEPDRYSSTPAAQARPSAIAQTISDWPRPASPQTKTPSTSVA